MKRKTLVYIGDNTSPEILIRHRNETKHDYVTRAGIHIALCILQLWRGDIPFKETQNCLVHGHLQKAIVKRYLEIQRKMLEMITPEKGKEKSKFELWLEAAQSNPCIFTKAEDKLHQILAIGEKEK